MKRILILFAVVISTMSVVAQEKVFDKGDRKMDLTIGVGTISYPDKSRATFDQHFGMEWGIANIAEKFTLGIGFNVNNSYGGSFESTVAGEYDYTYTYRSYGWVYHYSTGKKENFDKTKEIERHGYGTADAKISREDVNALFTAAFHYTPLKNLDTYAKVGVGIGVMNYIYSDFKNEKGFSEANENRTSGDGKISKVTDVYKYRDLDHVKWSSGGTKVCPSFAVYLGATYMLNDKWGVDGQIGLINANIKGSNKGYANSFGVFALGASYRF